MSQPTQHATNISILALALLAGFTTTHLTGCEKKTATLAAPTFTKADIVGTWRLAPGGEYAVARIMIRMREKSLDVEFTNLSVATATDRLMERIKKDPAVFVMSDDGKYTLTYATRTSQGDWTIENGRVVTINTAGKRTEFDYSDRTLDSRDPDPDMPSYRLFKD
ncbi:MAG: YuzB family protein [Phycisphaerales bacterium]|nr:YuzB family protein [Phycisphaerales bacterium]